MSDAVIFLSGAVAGWGLVRGIRHLAPRLGLIDKANERSLHRQPTPRGGGAAIVIICLLGVAVASAAGLRPERSVLVGYLAGALLIAGVSWVDDVRTVPSGVRLAVHALAAVFMLAGLGLQSELPPLFGHAGLGWLVVAGGLLWTVGLTNAYNFMDGIDGLAATQGIVAGLGWALLASLSNQPWIVLLALLLAAGCAGFLVYNWPPASIFMGDVGSAFLGFTFAFITLAASRRGPNYALAGGLLLWPFIFDATFTMLRRLRRGENIFAAHRSHLYQRLVLAGSHQAAVTSLYGLLAVVGVGLAALWWTAASANIGYLVIAVVAVLALVLWAAVIRAERVRTRTADFRSPMGR